VTGYLLADICFVLITREIFRLSPACTRRALRRRRRREERESFDVYWYTLL